MAEVKKQNKKNKNQRGEETNWIIRDEEVNEDVKNKQIELRMCELA